MTLAWLQPRSLVRKWYAWVALYYYYYYYYYYSFMAILVLACAMPHRAVTHR
jgi:hypothetical protein